MDRVGISLLLLFVYNVKDSYACIGDDIVAITGCNVSLEWTLRNESLNMLLGSLFIISHSSDSIIAELVHLHCDVSDKSSAYCNTYNRDDGLILSLTIVNVSAKESGNYTLWCIKGARKESRTSKKLVVIEKPKIIEVRNPVIGYPLEFTCSTLRVLECFGYRWRIGSKEVTPLSKENTLFVSSVSMTDNFSHITCHVCLNETARNSASVICENDACSTDSDPYTIQAIYGPDNISLSRHESHFYLMERDYFTIECFANCKPNCTFWWEGYDTIESEKLVIKRFESRMAGEYICYATNRQTNVTSKSNPITLHYIKETNHKEDDNGDLRIQQYWMGLVIVSAFLLIVGFFKLVTKCCKYTRKVIVVADFRELCLSYVGQTNNKNSSTSRSWPRSMGGSANTSRMAKPFGKIRRDKKVGNNHHIGSESSEIRKPREKYFALGHEDDLYSNIDQDVLSVYAIDKETKQSAHKSSGSAEHVFYDYADVHIADEAYITPVSDITIPFEICQNQEHDVFESYTAYNTPNNELVNPIEVCQVEGNDMNETDPTYLSTISG